MAGTNDLWTRSAHELRRLYRTGTASGCPAIAVPCRPSGSGLPIGFQLVAPWGGDERLLGPPADYEAAHPWPMLWEDQP